MYHVINYTLHVINWPPWCAIAKLYRTNKKDIHIYIHTYTHRHTETETHTQTHTNTHTHTHTHTYIYITDVGLSPAFISK